MSALQRPENIFDFERKVTNIEDNVSDLNEHPSPLEENMASQVPRPTFVRVKTKRKPKQSNTPSSPTATPASGKSLSPGESMLDVEVSPSQRKADGGSYYMGDVRKPDLNSHPASMGMPTTRTGFYNIDTGTTNVVCPFCFQKFTTTTVFENGHLDPGGPCEKFRQRLEGSQNTPKKGKSKAKGKGKEVDDEHQNVQPGSYHEMRGGEHQMDGGAQPVQGGDDYQGPHRAETYLGAPIEDVFQGFETGESARNFLGGNLGAAPVTQFEATPPFELPAADPFELVAADAGELPAINQFWGYQGFDGLPGFEENWEYYGPENGDGFPGFGMSGR